MNAKQYKKVNQETGRKTETVYFSRRGTKLAEQREGAKGWLQISTSPSKMMKVFYHGDEWKKASEEKRKKGMVYTTPEGTIPAIEEVPGIVGFVDRISDGKTVRVFWVRTLGWRDRPAL